MPWTRQAWRESQSTSETNGVTNGNSSVGDSAAENSWEPIVVMEVDETAVVGVESDKPETGEMGNGELIWARIGRCPWWPGLTIDGYSIGLPESNSRRWVFWFGDHRISKVVEGSCQIFEEEFGSKFDPSNTKGIYVKAIIEACTLAATRSGHSCQDWPPGELCAWAAQGFPEPPDPHTPQPMLIPEWVYTTLSGYQKKNLLARKEMSSDDETDDTTQATPAQGRVSTLKGLCIACRRPLKTFLDATEHPLFQANLCPACQIILKENMYAQDPSYPDLFMYCSVCGKPGSRTLACKSGDCGRVYCGGCVDGLASTGARRVISESRSWKCFVCAKPDTAFNRLLLPHVNWQQNVIKFFAPSKNTINIPPIPCKKKGIRVLSLFDGIGTGLVALTSLNISVAAYFAAEIDSDSIRVVQHRHGDCVTPVGDVRKVTASDIAKIGTIDLLIGGSPCTELSKVNPIRKGIYDCQSSGAMFFEFYRILCELQTTGKDHLFWLFENVAAMDAATKETITRFLKSEPFLVDAKNFSPQNRARLFWGNLPGMDSASQYIPKVLPELRAALVPGLGRKPAPELRSLRTVTTSSNSLRQGPTGQLPVVMDGQPDDIWVTELETVFGFPAHYTDLGNLGLRRRQRLLGRAWSVPVITRLFSPLTDFYLTERSK